MLKNILKLSLLSVLALTVLALSSCGVAVKTATMPAENKPIFVIDPGHGGIDGGAVAKDGTPEKDINLNIALKLQDFIRLMGYETVMTRTSDISIHDSDANTIREKKVTDIHNRFKILENNENNVFISIHQNIYPSASLSGSVVLYSPNNPLSRNLATAIVSSIKGLVPENNTLPLKKSDSSIYLLYNSQRPAVLVECGFLSNVMDANRLKTDEYQTKISFSIMNGVINYIDSSTAIPELTSQAR